jgi:putative aldouronate transport system permease protein
MGGSFMAEVVNVKASNPKKKMSKQEFLKLCTKQKGLILLSSIFIIYIFIFNYIPVWGWLMAFQDYKPALGISASKWAGLKHFIALFTDPNFARVMRNTLAISMLNLVFGYITAIGLAVFLNEVKSLKFKKLVQTISYLPHFVSWVVAASIVMWSLSTEGGIINILLIKLGIIDTPILFLGIPKYFWGIITASNIWKEIGWNAIIYLAAMTAIDPSLYEAASIDGAGRVKRILKITIPGIMPTIRILLIMQCGWILNTGFEQILLLQNSMTLEMADVLDTYTLRYGIALGRYSYATAAGIFKSIVSIILMLGANKLSKRFTGEGLV